MDVEIIPASIRDLGSLRRLERACFPKDAWGLLDLIAVLTMQDVIRIKAVIDGEMVGFVAGDPRPPENMAWIATIGVHPKYQRNGIGRMLLHACEDKITQQFIRLSVRVSNLGAIEMYKQEGYLPIDTWQDYYNDRENALVMEKIR
jgi:ribosomal protein S18 acetylase RimI-like enzyme